MVRRVHNLYQKTLKKYSGDVRLWVEYFEWCKKSGSSKVLGRTFAKAIQFHPTKGLLWILAAKWEWEENGNIKGSRILFQRGLRINSADMKMWLEYFKLELLWVIKLLERHKILFEKKKIDELNIIGEDFNGREEIDLPELEIEKAANNSEPLQTQEIVHSQEALINLLIPRIVYKNAVKSVPEDIHFRYRFIEIYKSAEIDTKVGIDEVYASIEADFYEKAECHKILAERHVLDTDPDDPHFPFALNACVDDYKSRLKRSASLKLYEYFTNFLYDLLNRITEPNLVNYHPVNNLD